MSLSGLQTYPEIRIGAAGNGSADQIDGNIAEILVYSTQLSPSTQYQVETYLAGKYGINIATPNETPLTQPSATASNFATWTPIPNAILTKGASGFDSNRLEEPSAIFDGTNYYVYYSASAYSGGAGQSIGMAKGPNLTSLVKQGQLLSTSTSATWDSGYVSGPRLYYEAGTYYLYFFGSQSTGHLQ